MTAIVLVYIVFFSLKTVTNTSFYSLHVCIYHCFLGRQRRDIARKKII